MAALKQWAFTMAVALICAALVELCAPSGKLLKAVKLCAALFLCMAFFAPFLKSGGIQLESVTVQPELSQQQEKFEQEMEKTVADTTCALLEDVLSENIYHKLGVQVLIHDITGSVEQGEFQVTSLGVTLWEGDSALQQQVTAEILNQLGNVDIAFTLAEKEGA